MADFIKYLPIATAIIGGCVAIYVWRGKRTKDAKDAFGGFIREQIGALQQRGIREFYERTKPSIRDAVHRVWHFHTEERRSRLDRLWSEYDQITAQELDSNNEGEMGEAMRRLSQIANPPADLQTPHEIVRYYLDEFYKFSA